MNTGNILQRIHNNSILRCRLGTSEAGLTVRIKIPDESNRCIVGLVPIDDESDDRFADYLIAEAWKAVERPEGDND